jgi:3-hydroxyisobutyrate dehydrogenase
MSKPRVAILGLGIMGAGMARRLLSLDFPVSVYNRNAERAKPFGDLGAFVASSAAEAASRSDVVISMVADDNASRSIWLGEKGGLAAATSGQALVECSTLTVNWVRELAAAAAQRGCELLDAPVTGSKPQAAAGELVFLIGGPQQTLEKAMPVLSAVGRDVLHFGPNGSGALMKLINNFMCGVQAASFAEAISLIEAGGLDRNKAVSVLTGGAPGSPLVKIIAARAAAQDFAPNFELRLMAKDLRYADEESQRLRRSNMEIAVSARKIFEQAIAAGYGEKDFSAVLQFGAKHKSDGDR